MDRLQNKAALITGAGAGIGAATARLFCAQGARVCLLDANPQALRDTQAKLLAEFPQASVHTAQADIADEGQAQAAVQTAVAALGGLDVLVNNAAMRNYAALADATPAEWQAMVGVNLVGTATMCRLCLPDLRASGRGSIVNVSSAHALIGRKGMGLYDSTKAGMLAMTRTLAFEEVQHGVRVNAVAPGGTNTAIYASFKDLPADADYGLMGKIMTPMDPAEPDEMANMFTFIASDEGRYMTGSIVVIDGGITC